MENNKGNEALKKLAAMSKADRDRVHNQNMGASKQAKSDDKKR